MMVNLTFLIAFKKTPAAYYLKLLYKFVKIEVSTDRYYIIDVRII